MDNKADSDVLSKGKTYELENGEIEMRSCGLFVFAKFIIAMGGGVTSKI